MWLESNGLQEIDMQQIGIDIENGTENGGLDGRESRQPPTASTSQRLLIPDREVFSSSRCSDPSSQKFDGRCLAVGSIML